MTCRAIQAVVSVVLLLLLLWWVDPSALVERLMSIKLESAAGALMLLLAQNELTTRRWSTAVGVFVRSPPHLRMLHIQYMALFAQLFLPSSIGSAAVRAGMLVRGGLSVGIAVNSVVLDRLIAFMGLALLALCFMPIATISLSVEKDGATSYVWLLAVAATVVAVVVALRLKPLAEWILLLNATPLRAFVEPLERAVPQMARPRFLLPAFLFSLCGQFAAIGAIYILARGSGIEVALVDCILIMPPVMLISALPISVAGWGIREGAMVIAFGLLGVAHEPALILSVQYAVIGYLAASPGAIGWFLEADRIALGRSLKSRDAEQGG